LDVGLVEVVVMVRGVVRAKLQEREKEGRSALERNER